MALFKVISLLMVWFFLQTTADVYQPECDSLQTAIDQIHFGQSSIPDLPLLDGASINCSKNSECTGLNCLMTIQDEQVVADFKLYPCKNPAQMYVLIQRLQSDEPFIEETLEHGDTFPIPGANYDLGIIEVGAALEVSFVKVYGGFQIGMNVNLVTSGGHTLQSIPVFPATVIQTGNCTDTGTQCALMEVLVGSLTPPYNFSCATNHECKGFNCSGPIQISQIDEITATVDVFVDSCANPVSYNLQVIDETDNVLWRHIFTHTESAFIGLPLPQGYTANLKVVMDPNPADITYINTTMELTICQGIPCHTFIIAEHQLVPIPPCDQTRTTPATLPTTTPPILTGASDECSTMRAIARDIQNNPDLAPGSIMCHATPGPACIGFTCNLVEFDKTFQLTLTLNHCDDPLHFRFVIEGLDNPYFLNTTIKSHEVISIDAIYPDAHLKFSVVKRRSAVEFALVLLLPSFSGDPIRVNLVADRLIPIASCGVIGTTKQTSATPKQTSATPTTIYTKAPPVTKATGKPGKKDDNQKDKLSTKSNPVTIGVGVCVALIGVCVVAVVALFLVRRYRRNRTTDELGLVSSSDASVPL